MPGSGRRLDGPARPRLAYMISRILRVQRGTRDWRFVTDAPQMLC